jgi:Domain of unknown function (DUF4262)
MTDSTNREAALKEIRQNIAEYGFHTYVVTGSGVPHYCYTIGLSESLRTELILAGAYFYELADVSKVIRSITGELRSPVTAGVGQIEASPWGMFSLRKVDGSWAQALMLGVFDYYNVKTIDAYQIVPDEAHWTVEIPDLSQPWSPRVAPAWRWLHERWTYPVPRDSVAITNLDALRGRRITEVMRWEEDEWEIFSGAGPDTTEAERRVVPLGTLLAADASLVPAVDLPIGAGFWRDEDSGWHPWGSSQDGKTARREDRNGETRDGN